MVWISKETLSRIAGGFGGKRVLVVGDLIVDIYLYVDSLKKSPERADLDIWNVWRRLRNPGGAANVAMNCASLGAETLLIGAAKPCEQGRWLRDTLTDDGVFCFWDNPYCEQFWSGTTTKTRVVRDGKIIARIDQDFTHIIADRALEYMWGRIKNQGLEKVDVLLISDYQKGAARSAFYLTHLVRRDNPHVIVTVNPKPALLPLLPNSPSLITMNRLEFSQVADPREDVRDVVRRLGCRHLLKTQGDDGVLGYGPGPDPAANDVTCWVKAFNVPDADVIGAGDSVFAAASLALTLTDNVVDLTHIANAAGGAKVSKKGTSPIYPAELAAYLCGEKDLDELNEGILV